MKKIVWFLVLLLAIGFLAGCSQTKDVSNAAQMQDFGRDFPDRQGDFGNDGQQMRGPQGMPDEQRQQMMVEMQQKSIDACSGKNEGDVCTIEAPQGRGPIGNSMEGTCTVENEKLVCKVERPDMPNHTGQPMFEEMQQKSIDACSGKTEGDSCTIEAPQGRGPEGMDEMQGTCKIENENLLCRFERQDMQFRPRPE